MDLSQLKTLIHVAELGSLSKAADRLGVVQPALSRQVRLLEVEFGTPLFRRHGRGMVPTEAGLEVLDRAVRVMAEIDEMRRSVSGAKTSLRGSVHVGMTPTVAFITTVPLARAIRDAHPDLTLRLSSAFSGHLLDWVQRGEIDVATSYDPQPVRSLRIEPVLREDLLLVGTSDRLSSSEPVPFRDLAATPLVLPSARHGLRTILDSCARRLDVTFDVALEVDSLQPMIDLVAAGFGSTVLPLAPVYDLIRSGGLRAAPIVDPSPSRTVVLASSMDRPLTAASRFLANTFREIAADLVTRGIWSGHLLDG